MIIWKMIRKIYSLISQEDSAFGRNEKQVSNKKYANALIADYILNGEACLITRFGANELNTIVNYLGVHEKKVNYIAYFKSQAPSWQWERSRIKLMYQNAGVFPMTKECMERFSQLNIELFGEIDILGSWLKEEQFVQHFMPHAKKIVLEDMEPFFTDSPWTWTLKGKKVLVVHPFENSIIQQYHKRSYLFDNDLLPEFELLTIKAPQSIQGENVPYADWFTALDTVKKQMDDIDFDICIIGCGAYGMPLAAHAKKTGHIAIHLGGVTQLLFGIIGKRWENYYYWPYANLFNTFWIRPSNEEVPQNATKIEDKCYW